MQIIHIQLCWIRVFSNARDLHKSLKANAADQILDALFW